MKKGINKFIRVILIMLILIIFSYEPTYSIDAKTYFNRGFNYYEKGQYDQAISNFTKALEINPRYGDAYYNRGLCYGRIGQYDLAIFDFNKAIEMNPTYRLIYNNRGFCYSRKGEYDQAISDFNKAIEMNPRDALAYTRRGLCYGRKGEYDQAISDQNKALEINPRYDIAYINRGVCYERKGEYGQAISDYNKAIGINPNYALAYNNLAWVFATTKGFLDGKKALEFAIKACELSGWQNPEFLDTLAAAHARVGDFNNAVKWQEKALESFDEGKKNEALKRLNLYREHKPWPSD